MIARRLPALVAGTALVAGMVLTLLAAPASAQPGINPSAVLAAKTAPRGSSFSDRVARIGSIMGGEAGRGARLRIPKRPEWTRARIREAGAR